MSTAKQKQRTAAQRIASSNFNFSEHFQKEGWTVSITGGTPGKIDPEIWDKLQDEIPFPTTYSSHFKNGRKEFTIFVKWDGGIYEEILLKYALQSENNTYIIINSENHLES